MGYNAGAAGGKLNKCNSESRGISFFFVFFCVSVRTPPPPPPSPAEARVSVRHDGLIFFAGGCPQGFFFFFFFVIVVNAKQALLTFIMTKHIAAFTT